MGSKLKRIRDCLHFLEQYTRGQSRDLVHSCQHLPANQGYGRAKSLLAEHFGNEQRIASAYRERILSWPPVKSEDVKASQSCSLFLRGCSNLTELIVHMKELDMPSNMRSIIMKLPYKLREKWRAVACELQEQTDQRAAFTDLVAFIEQQVKIASGPHFGNIQDLQSGTSSKASTSIKLKKRRSTFATNVTAVKEVKYQHAHKTPVVHSCLFCEQRSHLLDSCSQFKAKIHRDKINFIKEKGICFGCLKMSHSSKICKSRLECNVCHQRHPGVLHIERWDNVTSAEQSKDNTHVSIATTTTQTCVHIGGGNEDDSVFFIVVVQVKSKKSNNIVQRYVFLDPGSLGTFCTEILAKKMNLKGKRTSIFLRTMGQKKVVNTQIISDLEVSGLEANYFIDLPDVLTQKNMPVSTINVPRQHDIKQWPHLKGVKLHDIDAEVDLLIGTDAANVLEPWELINSVDGGPYAVRTKVGWVINGPLPMGSHSKSKNNCHPVTANRISVEHLKEMLVKQYNRDFIEKSSEEKLEMSTEDIKFMNIVNNSAKLVENHYHIDLPFK